VYCGAPRIHDVEAAFRFVERVAGEATLYRKIKQFGDG
jgi:hypothetical protein